MTKKGQFEIVDFDEQGRERVLSSEFTSAYDAAKAVAFGASFGLPEGVIKRQVRHIKSKEWVCEVSKRGV